MPDVVFVGVTTSSSVAHQARVADDRLVSNLGCGPWYHRLADAPPGSLIVNPTGLGKDRSGSPITDQLLFPVVATVWELNYRGQLAFLDRARRQAEQRHLQTHDGWDLFCHEWAAALSMMLDLPDAPDLGNRFVEAARPLRPRR